MTNELPVMPWEDRTSNYQTEIFSNMERMQSEIDEWREYFKDSKQIDISGLRRYGYDCILGYITGMEGGKWFSVEEVVALLATPEESKP